MSDIPCNNCGVLHSEYEELKTANRECIDLLKQSYDVLCQLQGRADGALKQRVFLLTATLGSIVNTGD